MLGRLETKHVVSTWVGEPSLERGGRRKKYYRLEPAGARALAHSHLKLGRMAAGLETEIESLASAMERSS